MFRLSPFFHQMNSPHSSPILSQEEQSATILINRIRANRKKRLGNRGGGRHGFFNFRAVTASRLQGYVVAGGMVIGAAVVLGPWLISEYKELLGLHYTPLDPSHQPGLGVEWWESEWRKMNTTWRKGESDDSFFENLCRFVESRTGRDLRSAESFVNTHPSHSPPPQNNKDNNNTSSAMITFRPSSSSSTFPRPRVLIPLCGDSPMLARFALGGYDVDGIDASQTAMRSAVERTERVVPVSLFSRIRLHWEDFFSPTLWEKGGPLDEKNHVSAASALSSGWQENNHGDKMEAGKEMKKGWFWGRFYSSKSTKDDAAAAVDSFPLSSSSHRSASASSSSSSRNEVPQFDLIYERQGMTSIPFSQREDYAYLLQRALKPDGLLYVEGIFRTGRVANNKHAGPPFGLSRRELRHLFSDSSSVENGEEAEASVRRGMTTDGSGSGKDGGDAMTSSDPSLSSSPPQKDPHLHQEEGKQTKHHHLFPFHNKWETKKKVKKEEERKKLDLFSEFHVECEERNDALASLSREDRVLRRVPRELYITPFHCVIYRKGSAAVNLRRVQELAQQAAAQVEEDHS